eukprot:gene12402-14353_t
MDDIMNMTKLGTILELDLHACEIAENILLQIASQCPRLQTLDLSDMRTKPITDGTLERCTHLRTVNLLDYGSSNAPPFVFSAQAISNLTSLYITGNIGSDNNLASIGLYGVKIEELTIDRCYECEHTHATLSSIVNGCPSLKHLYYKLQNEYIPTTPDYLTPEYWMKIRPNLQVTLVKDHDHDSDSE